PEPRDAAVDQALVSGRQLLVADTELVRDPRPEVLDDDVGTRRELPGDAPAFWTTEVQADALLVAVDHREAGAFAIDDHAHAALVVTLRRLDLDHTGAEIAQHRSTVGAGEDSREVQHQQPVEQWSFRRVHHLSPGNHRHSMGTNSTSSTRRMSIAQKPNTPRYVSFIGTSFASELIRNRFRPKGGEIIPISTLISTRMPNQTSVASLDIPRSRESISGMNTGSV